MFLQSTAGLHSAGQRIVSLVPSQTELLHYLGLEAETVGITKFCIHPPHWFAEKKRVGGTKTVDLAAVEALHPTLIIANKEENTKEQVEALAVQFPVWVTDISTLSDALQMITDIGDLTGTAAKAAVLVADIAANFAWLEQDMPERAKTAYLIWRKPYMAAGGGTFIQDMLARCGFINIFETLPRYPQVTPEQMAAAGCELLLLSSEPYPFAQKHIAELQAQLPHTKILLVDGEMFSWYGSRLVQAPKYFSALKQQASNR
jgi:ABC-type Fe3+-hydroxamate transport system substrate-binding protein